jgi:hypothetical protein
MSNDEAGLMLWGGVDLDLTLASLKQKQCEVCQAPATVAIRRLDEQERRYLCELHQKGGPPRSG